MTAPDDTHFMKHALALAQDGLGLVWPNPAVGCVIVKDGEVIAATRTQDGGRPHAESVALEMAGDLARGATAYVSLEPCNHHGKTPPCAQALIDAGIKRVVIACRDPDPRVSGAGIKALEDAGVEVVTGVCEAEALELNAGFFLRVTEGRPLVTLKAAVSADGKIALQGGKNTWITGEEARRYGHFERSQHDAILVGIGTALADDPALTTRYPGVDHALVRIVLDTHLRLPESAQLVKTAHDCPLWVFYSPGANAGQREKLAKAGVRLFESALMDVADILKTLAAEGLTRVLVEGGAQVHASFIRAGLFDRVLIFRAPKIIGDDGLPLFGGLEMDHLSAIRPLKRQKTMALGEDLLEIYTASP